MVLFAQLEDLRVPAHRGFATLFFIFQVKQFMQPWLFGDALRNTLVIICANSASVDAKFSVFAPQPTETQAS